MNKKLALSNLILMTYLSSEHSARQAQRKVAKIKKEKTAFF